MAADHADIVVVTSDNPRTEPPRQIISDVLSGISGDHSTLVEPDRAVAIEKAIVDARESDIVLIAGKGHESVQLVDGQSIPFDDRQVVMDILERNQST